MHLTTVLMRGAGAMATNLGVHKVAHLSLRKESASGTVWYTSAAGFGTRARQFERSTENAKCRGAGLWCPTPR